jgi:Uri superfamily endonuclease
MRSPAGSPAISDPAAALPALPGAYLLLLRREAPAVVAIARHRFAFGPGWYAYAGSARGPGGIRARAGRHLRARGRPHWHIDRLVPLAATRLVVPVPEGDECALAAGLRALPVFDLAAAGFGSSDCRRCPGHLFRFRGPDSPPGLLASLRVLLPRPGRFGACGVVGERFVVVEQDPLGGAVEILELAAAQRPHEGGEAGEAEEKGDRHEVDEHVQGPFSLWIRHRIRP